MAEYGTGNYKAIVHWRGWRKPDTHRFMTPESRERFIQQTQRSSRISKIVKEPK
jgi:hypothetical protein